MIVMCLLFFLLMLERCFILCFELAFILNLKAKNYKKKPLLLAVFTLKYGHSIQVECFDLISKVNLQIEYKKLLLIR